MLDMCPCVARSHEFCLYIKPDKKFLPRLMNATQNDELFLLLYCQPHAHRRRRRRVLCQALYRGHPRHRFGADQQQQRSCAASAKYVRGHRAAEHRLALLLHRRAQHARVRARVGPVRGVHRQHLVRVLLAHFTIHGHDSRVITILREGLPPTVKRTWTIACGHTM